MSGTTRSALRIMVNARPTIRRCRGWLARMSLPSDWMRLPEATGVPSCRCSSSFSASSGGVARSASMKKTKRPDAASIPVRIAAPLPLFVACCSRRRVTRKWQIGHARHAAAHDLRRAVAAAVVHDNDLAVELLLSEERDHAIETHRAAASPRCRREARTKPAAAPRRCAAFCVGGFNLRDGHVAFASAPAIVSSIAANHLVFDDGIAPSPAGRRWVR